MQSLGVFINDQDSQLCSPESDLQKMGRQGLPCIVREVLWPLQAKAIPWGEVLPSFSATHLEELWVSLPPLSVPPFEWGPAQFQSQARPFTIGQYWYLRLSTTRRPCFLWWQWVQGPHWLVFWQRPYRLFSNSCAQAHLPETNDV